MSPQNPKPIFNDVLAHTAEQTFGELAFMLVIPEDSPHPQEKTPLGYAAGVDFSGPFGGKLFVGIAEETLHPLAENMLGIDPGESMPEGVTLEDALKELLNVICGNLLPAIAGDEAEFNIGGPELLPVSQLPAEVPGQDFAGKVGLDLDSGRAEVVMFVEQGAEIPEICPPGS
ncbi:MAG: chemotaxis protein CheX [Phycisphaerae bacterium]|nr:chemotaxis protein CheX [Phycisphaerae bacterium]